MGAEAFIWVAISFFVLVVWPIAINLLSGGEGSEEVVNIDIDKMELVSREKTEGEIKEVYKDGNREITVIARTGNELIK